MSEKDKKSITKELDVCHDCAEYGGHFCDQCLEEIKKMKKENTDFEIESLDPDKRSWYYDDTGVKRKKDNNDD